ncbi:MAG: type II 3-dehydroquinate dehydratase [Elusimicrobiota bacterium]
MNILVLHGPNLNLLGEREPAVYGAMTLAQLDRLIRAEASRLGLRVRIFQSNHEGGLIDLLHKHRRWAEGVLINPGAYTHYSYALRDALTAVALPAVEVHLSDIRKREKWRRISVTAPACAATILGKGAASYLDGLKRLKREIGK